MSAPAPSVSLVVPVYRNRDTVARLQARFRAAMAAAGLTHETLFVDDACPEGSRLVLERLAAEDPSVGVLSLPRNVGQHRAVLCGLAYARGERAVVMDADLQDPPEAIPLLLERLAEPVAAVFAGRRGDYESRARLLTSRVFKELLHLVARIPRDAGICVAMDRRMVGALLAMRVEQPFVPAMIGFAGLPMVSIPVARSPRPTGRSTYGSWGRIRSGTRALRLALRLRRTGAAGAPAALPAPALSGCVLGRAAAG